MHIKKQHITLLHYCIFKNSTLKFILIIHLATNQKGFLLAVSWCNLEAFMLSIKLQKNKPCFSNAACLILDQNSSLVISVSWSYFFPFMSKNSRLKSLGRLCSILGPNLKTQHLWKQTDLLKSCLKWENISPF